jgi:DNA-binding response OmpR family regulator
MSKILIIDDDPALCQTLTLSLEGEGYRVVSESDGLRGLERALREAVDLIVLDLSLPGLPGTELLKKLRGRGNVTPVIILTGQKKEEIDRVLGLELGADDYMLKPFGTKELVARVHAVLRRGRPVAPEPEEVRFEGVEVYFKRQTASRDGRPIHLTAKEFGLLRLLVSREGEVVSRQTILNKVWGYDSFPSTRTVDTFVHNLRRKIEADPAHPRHLITVAWSGYKFQK